MLYTCFLRTMSAGRGMAKELYIAELFEQYKDLLTPHRKTLVYEYYILDLSLGEIAERAGVTRQSVNDGLQKAKEQLIGLENALHLAKKAAAINAFGEKLKKKDGALYAEFSEIFKD